MGWIGMALISRAPLKALGNKSPRNKTIQNNTTQLKGENTFKCIWDGIAFECALESTREQNTTEQNKTKQNKTIKHNSKGKTQTYQNPYTLSREP